MIESDLYIVGYGLFKNGPIRTGGWKRSAKIYTTRGQAEGAKKLSGNVNAVVRPLYVRLTLETLE